MLDRNCIPQVKKDNEEITSMEKMYVHGIVVFCVFGLYHRIGMSYMTTVQCLHT